MQAAPAFSSLYEDASLGIHHGAIILPRLRYKAKGESFFLFKAGQSRSRKKRSYGRSRKGTKTGADPETLAIKEKNTGADPGTLN